MPWRLLLLGKTSEFSLPTSCQGMKQLPTIRINSNINYKSYKCKCLCLMQISKCLSRKLYKVEEKTRAGRAEPGAELRGCLQAAMGPHQTWL